MSTFAPELNFVLAKSPYEITDYAAGETLISQINAELIELERITGVAMRAKLDPFHTNPETEAVVSWSVEVCPVHSFDTEWLSEGVMDEKGNSNWSTFRLYMNWLFKRMKKGYGLVPSVQKKRRDGTEVHMPGGGAHIHYGANLFGMGPNFYKNMERFHTDLAVSYANRPYLRFLFADWLSDRAHHTLWNPEEGKVPTLKGQTVEHALFGLLLDGGIHAIESRFMNTAKGSHNTFEFRFFRMVENPDELRLIVRFVEAWVNHLRMNVYWGVPVCYSLTKRKWREFKDGRTVWLRHIAPFLKELGLNPKDYRMFFTRNYLTRLKFGKME